MQLGTNPKSKGKGKDGMGKGKGKDGKTESSKKAQSDDKKNEDLSREVREQKELKDLAAAEGQPVAATTRPSGTTTASVPLQCLLQDESHTSTFILALPCANDEPSDESSSEGSTQMISAGPLGFGQHRSGEAGQSARAGCGQHRPGRD